MAGVKWYPVKNIFQRISSKINSGKPSNIIQSKLLRDQLYFGFAFRG